MSASKPVFRLFLVDDEESILRGLAELFPWQEWGFSVAGTFQNGQKALEALHMGRAADIILSDIRMPVMDGLALAQHIHDEDLPVRVVFLSAYTDFDYARQGLQYGVCDYVVKPISYEKLEATFRAMYAALSEALPPQAPPPGEFSEDSAARGDLASQVDAYIASHLRDANVSDAAQAVRMSSQVFSRSYKRLCGISFTEALYRARMKQAASLVCGLHMRLFHVAEALGYDNAKNFTRAFRRYYGVSPNDYRKAHLNTSD